MPAGIAEASRRFGRLALSEIVAPAAALARDGVTLTAQQAYIVEILHELVTLTPECGAIYSAPDGAPLREGEIIRQPALADTMELLGAEGAAPFYRGSVALAAVGALAELGGLVTMDDLAAYRVVDRTPVRVRYRGRDVLTNPPPSAGGTLIAYALALLERGGRVDPPALVATMDATQAERTDAFVAGLAEPGFAERFLAGRLGSTTHVSVIDADGGACSVTSSNGEGAGLLAPGTGIHLNNMLGEQDLNPLGFHSFPPGRRLPSMMAPTAVLRDGRAELVLGSAGSNRIRSAILQTVVNVVDRGMGVEEAVRAPRLHAEEGVVYVEPGIEAAGLEAGGHALARFRARNLFFGGVQAVARDPATGAFGGAGDPRRGGAAVVA
jgi:gamma-glutamyltranspeptidase/glutathione hydrolase